MKGWSVVTGGFLFLWWSSLRLFNDSRMIWKTYRTTDAYRLEEIAVYGMRKLKYRTAMIY